MGRNGLAQTVLAGPAGAKPVECGEHVAMILDLREEEPAPLSLEPALSLCERQA